MKVETHRRDASKYIEGVSNWTIPDNDKEKVKMFFKEYISGRVTNKKPNNPDAIIEKCSSALRMALEYFGKKPSKEDVIKFFDALVVNKTLGAYNRKTSKFDGRPYPPKSQVEIIRYVKLYLNWRYSDAELVSPLNVRLNVKKRDIESLTVKEIESIYRACKNNEERYIIGGLFCTGARMEEFLSLRLCDVTLPEKDEFIKVTIRNATSKTQGRTVSCYWSKSFECIPDYIREREKEGAKPTDYILTKSYDSLKKWFPRIGLRVLKKNIHAHMFRHACADYLSSKLNRQQLCVFFGWAFSSSMPDIYISRNNVDMSQVEEKIKSNTYEELQSKLLKTDLENKIVKEKLDIMNSKFELFQKVVTQLGIQPDENGKIISMDEWIISKNKSKNVPKVRDRGSKKYPIVYK